MVETSIPELFSRTLVGDYDDEGAWEAVHKLRKLGTREVFDIAADWCRSDTPLKRARGADVIAQLGKTFENRSNSFPEEAYTLITQLVKDETDARPLASAIAALGHLDNVAAVPLIARFASHSDSEVRFDVAFALGCFPDEPLSVATLQRLMTDPNDDVRDWATFGLGVLGSIDSDQVRDSLAHNLLDSDSDVLEEALSGLAKRADLRALHPLLDLLERPEVSSRVIEAATMMLGLDQERDDWSANDYAAQIRTKFADRM